MSVASSNVGGTVEGISSSVGIVSRSHLPEEPSTLNRQPSTLHHNHDLSRRAAAGQSAVGIGQAREVEARAEDGAQEALPPQAKEVVRRASQLGGLRRQEGEIEADQRAASLDERKRR